MWIWWCQRGEDEKEKEERKESVLRLGKECDEVVTALYKRLLRSMVFHHFLMADQPRQFSLVAS